jgi:hypothetical protein
MTRRCNEIAKLAQEGQMADFCEHSDEQSRDIKKGISLPDENHCYLQEVPCAAEFAVKRSKNSNILIALQMSAVNCRLCEFPTSCALRFVTIFYVTVRINLVINCIVLSSWCRLLGTYGGQ